MTVTGAVTVTVVDHPLVVDALARIRDRTTPNALFRQNLERIGTLLLARATETLPTVDTTVETPLTVAPAKRLQVQPVVVPILRAGLGFVHAAQELLPDADVGFVGISRDEATFAPQLYVNKLPEALAGRPVIVVDPMLATGGSLVHTVELLLERHAPTPITVVCALCAPEGIARLRAAGLSLHVVTAAIDDHLNDSAFIVPGLGDAGDRQFGPPA
jgi:uracil phosphoribosyltransferase